MPPSIPKKKAFLKSLFSHPNDQPKSSGHQGAPSHVNGCYYANWRVKSQPPSSLNIDYVSHIFYAFAFVKPDGTVYLSDPSVDAEMPVDGTSGCIKAWTKLKEQRKDLKVILSVGGAVESKNFAAVAANADAIEKFASTSRQLVDEFGLDGIDVDWEHPKNTTEGQHLIELLSRLRDFLPSPQYTLTAALPAGEWALRHIDLPLACRYLDYINLMSYCFSGPWTPLTGHQAQLYTPAHPHSDTARNSGDAAVVYMFNKGIPAQKILFGIPLYGRSFIGADYIGQKYTGSVASGGGTYDWKDMVKAGVQQNVDESVGAAWMNHPEGGFVTLDNARTVQMKGEYAVKKGLGGLFYWHIGCDSKGEDSLVKCGFDSMHGS